MDPPRVLQCGIRPAAAQRIGTDQDSHRTAVPGDRDFLTLLDAGQQFGERGPASETVIDVMTEIVRRCTQEYSHQPA